MEGSFESLKRNIKNLSLKLLYSLSIVIYTIIYDYLNNFRGRVYSVESRLDSLIPFTSYFVVPYVIWYFYIAFFLIYFAVNYHKKYFQMIMTLNIGVYICFIIYLIYPTTVIRPDVSGNDVFSRLLRLIYARDNPYNCFPSIHSFASVLFAIYVNREKGIKKFIKWISSIIAISIVLSTLFIKQHYFYDALSAIILSYGIYYAFNFKDLQFVKKFKLKKTIENREIVEENVH